MIPLLSPIYEEYFPGTSRTWCPWTMHLSCKEPSSRNRKDGRSTFCCWPDHDERPAPASLYRTILLGPGQSSRRRCWLLEPWPEKSIPQVWWALVLPSIFQDWGWSWKPWVLFHFCTCWRSFQSLRKPFWPLDYPATSAKLPSTSSPRPSPNHDALPQAQSPRSTRCLFPFPRHSQLVIEALPFLRFNFPHWLLICVDAMMPFSYWEPSPYASSLLPYGHAGRACGLCLFWWAPLSSAAAPFSSSILPLLNICQNNY